MNWLVPKEWLLIALFCAAALVGVKFWESRLIDEGRSLERADNNQRLIAEQAKAAEKTAAWQKQKDEALHDANERAIKAKADAERLRVTNGGLRNELAAARGQLSSASCDSVRRHAAALNTVFEQCAREVEDLAGAASGIASDTMILQQAWPK